MLAVAKTRDHATCNFDFCLYGVVFLICSGVVPIVGQWIGVGLFAMRQKQIMNQPLLQDPHIPTAVL